VTAPLSYVDSDTLRALLNVGAAFACAQMAADILEKGALDDEEAAALGWLPDDMRLQLVARFLDASEAIREGVRDLDGFLVAHTFGE
jgi:hypothetical protein